MTISLPPEIWAHILAQLPDSSLHLIQYLNRMFYQLCRKMLGVLDLAMNFSSEDIHGQLGVLSKRLQDAEYADTLIIDAFTTYICSNRSHPLLVNTLSLSPGFGFQVLKLSAETEAKLKPKAFPGLRRILRAANSQIILPMYRLTLKEALKTDSHLASLIPSLTSLHTLNYKWATGWESRLGSNFELALKVASTHLTVLSLYFSFKPSGAFLDPTHSISFTLPALQTIRLRLKVSPSSKFEAGVQKIIAASPLLEEIQYHIDGYGGHVPLHLTTTVPYSRLRSFKWTTVTSTTDKTAIPLAMPISPLFAVHSSQCVIVHLNPIPSIEAFGHIALQRLVELRVDVSLCPSEFYFPIGSATRLETLEITGVDSIYPASLFPQGGLKRLKRLYFGITFELFNPDMFKTLTDRLPNLETFALLSEPQHGKWVYGTLWVTCDAISSAFQASAKIQCNIRDFGIIPREWNRVGMSRISHLTRVLRDISEAVPSITSFYGTGSLHLWEGMEDDIEENWGGELWRQKRGRW
ncbi:hypothetical protein DL96DRAFT_1635792 [Flagelloscypha sp. PMI_526]|nr:hypothetical protein DL96DRAFT_1635792 [Flagelloscypha sp. PMI_526]